MAETIDRKPLVSFIILAYNQEKFVGEAVKAALEQNYSPLEIIISDDASPDSTFNKIKEIVSETPTKHEVKLNQNPRNLGLSSHVNRVLGMARGEIILFAAGDDVSKIDRTEKTVAILHDNPLATFVSFKARKIDSEGRFIGCDAGESSHNLEKITLDDYISEGGLSISGATRGFRREVYDFFGPLSALCPTEDTTYNLRCLLLGQGVLSPDIGIYYRIHENNLSAPESLNNMAIDLVRDQYLDDCNRAYEGGKISGSKKVKIENWINERYAVQALRVFLYRNRKSLYACIARILFFRGVPLRERVRFLARLYAS